MCYQENLIQLESYLEKLKKSGKYDADVYLRSLLQQTSQLHFYYCHLLKKRDEREVFYNIRRRPKEHQLAYFNIGRGYPKELCDGHWCYVVKDFGIKMFIIPCTSIKDAGHPGNFELEINIQEFKNATRLRMQLGDARVVDIQRLDQRKEFVEVCDSRESIEKIIRPFYV